MPARAATDVCSDRLRRLRRAIKSERLDALLITNPKDVGYLTGFLGGDSYLLIAKGKPTIISDGRYEEDLAAYADRARIVMRAGSFEDEIRRLVTTLKPARLGYQADHLTVTQANALGSAVGSRRLVPTSGWLAEMRRVKDETELSAMRAAVRLQEAALEAVIPSIRPGALELGLAADIEAEMKRRGASQPGFTTIVAAGAHASLPHYHPAGRAKVKKNNIVLIDWGAVRHGYNGDMTRTFAVGRWPRVMKEVYQIVLEAHERSAAALRAGRTNLEIDAVARNYITGQGFGEQFGHGLGHSMGLDNKEDPRLNPLYPAMELEPGNVVTIEPGIYLPGVGGVRIEDDYVVTRTGSRNLCSMPKDLAWATLS